tara:strand:+ start:976 stop:1605 length:630 start_codon:yes stop_codon:yes gene_type:complete
MSLTINHQTNDISATGAGSVTIGGAAVGGGPVLSGLKTIAGMDQIAPIDLGYYSGLDYTSSASRIYFVPWVAPADGTLNAIEIYIPSNSVSTSSEIGLGIYSNSSGPSSRLAYGTFDPNGAGTGWKSVTGLAQSVSANTLYWLAFSSSSPYTTLEYRGYRRNSFYPRPDTTITNDDYVISMSGNVSSTSTASSLVVNTNEPPYLAGIYL